jgi:hypothetical protein
VAVSTSNPSWCSRFTSSQKLAVVRHTACSRRHPPIVGISLHPHSRLPFPLCPAGNVTRRCVRPLVLLCAVSPFLLHVRSPGLPPVWYACRRARMADESRPSVFASLWIFESVEIPKRLLTLFPGAWRRHGKWILRSRAVGPHRPLQISGALLSPYVCSTDTCTTA